MACDKHQAEFSSAARSRDWDGRGDEGNRLNTARVWPGSWQSYNRTILAWKRGSAGLVWEVNKGTGYWLQRDLRWLVWLNLVCTNLSAKNQMTNTAETRLAAVGVCGRGSDSCYIISHRLICLWSRVVFVWTGSESHFLFTSIWTHPWSSSSASMRTSSRVASTGNVLRQHLA